MAVKYDPILGKIRAAEHAISQNEIRALFDTSSPDLPQNKIDWSNYEFIQDGVGKYTRKYKVQTVEGLNIVNIQHPAFATQDGIYITLPALITNCSVESTIQGAGILLHLAAFKTKETKVTICYDTDSEITFYVYYADATTQQATLMSASANSATKMTATVGSVSINNASSQTANTKAIKLNASGYIAITPLEGQVFLPGDILSVTLYNQSSSSRLMGFKLGSTQATPYIGDGINTEGRKNKTLTLTLTADMLTTANRVLLYRYSADAWFVAIRVTR